MNAPIPYAPRPRRWLGVLDTAGYRLKQYAISLDGTWPGDDWQPALDALLAALPQPTPAPGRSGLGLLILHRGNGADYAVLGWWDRDNELPLRLRIRPTGEDWRAPLANESVCVWDLELIGFERDAWVATVLAGGHDVEAAERAYLARHAAPA